MICYEYPPLLTFIDIHPQTKEATIYANFPLAFVNDYVITVSIITNLFYWHLHLNSDESFLVVEGSLYIDLDITTIELFSGQLFTIPKNTKHRTRPNDNRSVNLIFEYQNMETIKMGH